MADLPTTLVKSLGAYRKDVYALFEQIVGREMSDDEHARIKKILTDYLSEHRVIVDTTKPHEHIYTCAACRSQKKGKGHQFAKRHNKHVIKEEVKEV